MLRYLRQREIVHYQRFAEGLQMVQEKLDDRNFYAFNMSLPITADCGGSSQPRCCANRCGYCSN